MKGFIEFIREQGVIGLAIGFVLGGAVSGVVSSLVADIINPTIGLFMERSPESGLNSLAFAGITYGRFLSVILDFLIIAAVIYFVFKGLKLDQLDKKKQK